MKRLALLLPLLALAAAPARADDPATSAPVIHARRDAMDALFGGSGQEVFVSVTNGVVDAGTRAPDGDEDLSYHFMAFYDDDMLYVLVLVRDDDVCADTCPTGAVSCAAWDDDAVEVFIDGDYARLSDSRADGGVHLKHGGEFALVANGAANSDFSGYPNSYSGWDGATRRPDGFGSATNKLWGGSVIRRGEKTDYLFLIPWAAMGRTNAPERIGFNIGVQDDDGGGHRDHALYWTGNPKRPFSDESAFGVLVFDPNAEAAAPAPHAQSAESAKEPAP